MFPLLHCGCLGVLVYFNKTFIFGKPQLHQEAAGASIGTNKTISSKQSTVQACLNFPNEHEEQKLMLQSFVMQTMFIPQTRGTQNAFMG